MQPCSHGDRLDIIPPSVDYAVTRSHNETQRRVTKWNHWTYRDLYRDALGIDPLTASDDELRAALGNVQIDPAGLVRDDWLDLLMTHRLQPAFATDALLAVVD